MLNNFIGPVSNLVGTWLNNKKEEKQAKHQAKMNVIQNDANWEQIMAESSKDSWKEYNGGDETEWYHIVGLFVLLGILFAIIFFFGPETTEVIPDMGE